MLPTGHHGRAFPNSPFLTHLAQKQTARSSRAVANDPFSACPERSEGTIDQRLPVTHVSSKHPSLCEAVRPSEVPSSCSRRSAQRNPRPRPATEHLRPCPLPTRSG